jgi:hypothetical protein
MAEIPADKPVEPIGAAAQAADGEKKPISQLPPSPRAPEVPPAVKPKWYSKYDPKEIREWGKLAIEFITLVAVIWYACVASHQLIEMRQTNIIISRQLEMTDRPWIKDDVTSAIDLSWQNGALVWAVIIKTDNVGHSVATGIYPEAKLIAIQGADFIDTPRREAKKICDDVDRRFENIKSDPAAWANSAFPGAALQSLENAYLFPDQIKNRSFDGGQPSGQSVLPMLIGCIGYHYPTSERIHHTAFIYGLARTDDPSIPEAGRGFFTIGKNIPKANVTLFKTGQIVD